MDPPAGDQSLQPAGQEVGGAGFLHRQPQRNSAGNKDINAGINRLVGLLAGNTSAEDHHQGACQKNDLHRHDIQRRDHHGKDHDGSCRPGFMQRLWFPAEGDQHQEGLVFRDPLERVRVACQDEDIAFTQLYAREFRA